MSGNNNEAFEKWYDSVREYKCSEKELLIILWNNLQAKLDKAVEALDYSDSLIIELWRRVVPLSERENEYLESRVYSQGEINERVLKEIKEGE